MHNLQIHLWILSMYFIAIFLNHYQIYITNTIVYLSLLNIWNSEPKFLFNFFMCYTFVEIWPTVENSFRKIKVMGLCELNSGFLKVIYPISTDVI